MADSEIKLMLPDKLAREVEARSSGGARLTSCAQRWISWRRKIHRR